MSGDALYLGLISGTSADGIDVALVAFEPAIRVVAAQTRPWPEAVRQAILAAARSEAATELKKLGELDARIGAVFADAALALLDDAGVEPAAVRALGSHGQTVCHGPHADPPFTLQLGNAAVIAERTGIDVVADFRAADVAAGGQGAPLVPAFHQAVFGDNSDTRVIVNLGGIANITVLAPGRAVIGFDTGPANCLMDAWAAKHRGTPCDAGGAWAASGRVDQTLLAALLDDPYFAAPAPKSSGREYFNLEWLARHPVGGVAAADVQATLMALSALSIAEAIALAAPATTEVVACGGGTRNPVLMRALDKALGPARLTTTASLGVDPDFVEAAAFAWLARQRLLDLPGNLPSVTGARGPRVLGVVARAPRST